MLVRETGSGPMRLPVAAGGPLIVLMGLHLYIRVSLSV